MNIAIIDDQKSQREDIQNRLRTIQDFEIESYSFSSISEFEASHIRFDLLLLDIDMPIVNGLDYARENTEHNIIFITSHHEYMKRAFGPRVYGFIEKSDSIEDFQTTIINTLHKISQVKCIHIKTKKGSFTIPIQDIIYVQYIRRKTLSIQLKDEEYIISGYTLKECFEKLGDRFVFCDRDTIVNIDMIIGISENRIFLKNIQHKLLMSSRRINRVKEVYYRKVKEVYDD